MGVTLIGDGVQLGEVERTLGELKAAKHEAVSAEFTRRMGLGFPWDFGTPEAPDLQTLQVATPDDKTNWLTLMFGCQAAIAGGAGAAPVDPPLRCTSNAQFTPSILEVAGILQAMQTWGGGVLKASWALKNAVDAVTDLAALEAVDISSDAAWAP